MEGFETDGCTGFPDKGFFGTDWGVCCLEHDIAYWTREAIDGAQISKWTADFDMFACMASLGPEGAVAGAVALLGISAFGWLFWRRGKRGERV